MDLAKFAEQDMADASVSATAFPPKGPSVMDEECVTWQSSQRREVLSRFMVSTKKQFQRDSSPPGSQGWPLGPFGTESSSQNDSGNLAAFSRYTRPLSRTRTSEWNIEPHSDPAKSSTNDRTSPIPFFDKENPTRFLALLKGVSARVDENAGVRNYDIPGPSGPTDGTANLKRKRPQMTSVGRSLAGKRIRPTTSEGENTGENGRISNEFKPALSKPQILCGYQSLPDVTSEDIFSQETKESHESPRISSSFLQEFNDPPLPSPSAKQKHFDDTKCVNPKLHPLLQNAPSEPSSMTPHESDSRVAWIRGLSSTPVTGVHSGKTLSPGSATSSRTSTPGAAGVISSSRPPALGMRRTRTMPSQRYGLQTRTTPDLPTKQKGFKPPLLPNQSPSLTLKAKPPS